MNILLGFLVIVALFIGVIIVLFIIGYPISLLITATGWELPLFTEYDYIDDWEDRRLADISNGIMFILLLTLLFIVGIISYEIGSKL